MLEPNSSTTIISIWHTASLTDIVQSCKHEIIFFILWNVKFLLSLSKRQIPCITIKKIMNDFCIACIFLPVCAYSILLLFEIIIWKICATFIIKFKKFSSQILIFCNSWNKVSWVSPYFIFEHFMIYAFSPCCAQLRYLWDLAPFLMLILPFVWWFQTQKDLCVLSVHENQPSLPGNRRW